MEQEKIERYSAYKKPYSDSAWHQNSRSIRKTTYHENDKANRVPVKKTGTKKLRFRN
jgi:hypothetical protein